jgi:phosphatidylglycerophosphate synthase
MLGGLSSPAPPAVSPAASSARRSFAERYRAMRSRWNSEWWSVMLGGPVGNFLNAFIADVSWITPNGITWVSFLCKLAAVPLILLGSWSADLAVIALFQAHTVLDCMDGSLARYRKKPSAMGAFLDKTTDMIGLVGIMAALGWRAHADDGDALALVVAMLIASGTLLRFYVYWVVMHLEREAKVAAPSVGDKRFDYSTMTAKQRFTLYVKSMTKVVFFSEADFYFWFALGLLLGKNREMIYFMGVTNGVWLILILGRRYWAVHQIDARARKAAIAATMQLERPPAAGLQGADGAERSS